MPEFPLFRQLDSMDYSPSCLRKAAQGSLVHRSFSGGGELSAQNKKEGKSIALYLTRIFDK
jgi:hypothetical protein